MMEERDAAPTAAAMQAASSADYDGQGGQQSAQQLHPQHPGAGLDLGTLFKGCTSYEPVRIERDKDNYISLRSRKSNL